MTYIYLLAMLQAWVYFVLFQKELLYFNSSDIITD